MSDKLATTEVDEWVPVEEPLEIIHLKADDDFAQARLPGVGRCMVARVGEQTIYVTLMKQGSTKKVCWDVSWNVDAVQTISEANPQSVLQVSPQTLLGLRPTNGLHAALWGADTENIACRKIESSPVRTDMTFKFFPYDERLERTPWVI